MTRSIADAALVYDALAGHDPLDPSSSAATPARTHDALGEGIAGLRLGLVSNLACDGAAPEPAILAALDRAAAAFRAAGAIVVDVDLPIAPSTYRAVAAPINRSESFSIHESDYLRHRHLMGRALREKLAVGMYMRAADYLAALRERRRLVAETDRLFDAVDVLLLPMTYSTVPRLDDGPAVKAYTTGSAGSPFSLTGHPALAMPAGFDDGGLPVSVQLAAGFNDERTLLRAAAAVEPALHDSSSLAPVSAATPTEPA